MRAADVRLFQKKKTEMNKKTQQVKIVATHPVTGTKKKFDISVYTGFKAAILESLGKSKGKTFSDLADNVTRIIRKKMPDFKGSVPWYTISVRLDLETRGILETFNEKGKKLCRLKK
jgi:hypothetical protein